MRIEEFDYALPRSLIAQYPSPQRGDSRLMVLHRSQGTIEHRNFQEILHELNPGDLLVVNNTRVFPARLTGRKETGGRCEILCVPSWNGDEGKWEALIKGTRKTKRGTRIRFSDDFQGEVEEVKNGRVKIRFSGDRDVMEHLRKFGHIPLPPYIKRKDEPLDGERYQTIYAEIEGSIAAPTAGFHFNASLLELLRDRGIHIASITLHVGAGTFTPVKSKEIEDHQMEAEWIEISEEAVREVNQAKERRKRVIAVGTTTTRALESFSSESGALRPGKGMASLFIYPPYRFRIIDGLITNFHLPRSTLLMLVSAFTGKDLLTRAYREAIDRKYQFYSYGDAMLVL